MPDISEQIQAINEAIYGEEVRGSIVEALEAVNARTEIESADAAAASAAAAAASAVIDLPARPGRRLLRRL